MHLLLLKATSELEHELRHNLEWFVPKTQKIGYPNIDWALEKQLEKRQISRMQEQQNPNFTSTRELNNAADNVPFIPPGPDDYYDDDEDLVSRFGLNNRLSGANGDNALLKCTPNVIGPETVYDGCGETKTCFGFPDGCVTIGGCQVSATLWGDEDNPNTFHVAIQATDPRGFVALGFSRDQFMVCFDKILILSCASLEKVKKHTKYYRETMQ